MPGGVIELHHRLLGKRDGLGRDLHPLKQFLLRCLELFLLLAKLV